MRNDNYGRHRPGSNDFGRESNERVGGSRSSYEDHPRESMPYGDEFDRDESFQDQRNPQSDRGNQPRQWQGRGYGGAGAQEGRGNETGGGFGSRGGRGGVDQRSYGRGNQFGRAGEYGRAQEQQERQGFSGDYDRSDNFGRGNERMREERGTPYGPSGSYAGGHDEGLHSRSADPGQSSYGGFSNEDTRFQRQQLDPYSGGRGYPRQHQGDQYGYQGGQGQGDQYGSQSGQRQGDQYGHQGGRHQSDQYGSQGGRHQGDQYGSQGGQHRGDQYGYQGGQHQGGQQSGGQGGSQQARYSPKGYSRSDERVREDICERLSHSGLDVSEVSVHVSKGQVTLEGTVKDRQVKHAIENHADACMGVQDVDNKIRVQRDQGYARGETSMGQSSSAGSSGKETSSSGASGSASTSGTSGGSASGGGKSAAASSGGGSGTEKNTGK